MKDVNIDHWSVQNIRICIVFDAEKKRPDVAVVELFFLTQLFRTLRYFRMVIIKNWDRVVSHEGEHDQDVEDGTSRAVAGMDLSSTVPWRTVRQLMREDVYAV